MKVTRRGILAGTAAGGGLLVAWAIMPRSFDTPLDPGKHEFAFDAWLKIAEDGVVSVAVPQLEMGQGITTILPQIIAMELGADWRQIAVEPAPISGAYANMPLAAHWAPLWQPLIPSMADDPDALLLKRWAQDNRFTVTADGTSLDAYEAPCRDAAASARAMLAMAAAARWGVSWEECQASEGFITHGENKLSFGELAAEAAQMDAPSTPPLLPRAAAQPPSPSLLDDEPIDYPRLDLPSKVDGSFLFAGDVRLPDMVYAAIKHGPVNRSELTRFEPSGAAGQKGLVGIVRGRRWLAAAAETWWGAEQALNAMEPLFSVDDLADSESMDKQLDAAVRSGSPHRIAQRGEPDENLQVFTLALRYNVAPALHATVETATATARLVDGKLELWLATQAPERARRAAARAVGISAADVVLYPMPAGGSFDRRLEDEHAIEVAVIAKQIGRPVQLVWSRWQEHLAGHPRPPVAAVLSAKAKPDGQIESFRARLACPPAAKEFGHRLFDNHTSWAAINEARGMADPMAVAGAFPPYSIPHVAVDHTPVSLPLPSGRMRANAHGYTCFMVESFIDEMATRHNLEPLSYRIAMLGGDLRLAACLQRAARLAMWDGGISGSGQGLACHTMASVIPQSDEEGAIEGGGRIAVIAEASGSAGGITVTKLCATVDIGRVVNRDIALQQIEGGLIFGLGLALGSATRYKRGLPTSQRLSALALPTLANSPEIEIELIASNAPAFDPGEIGVPAVAPAIANALFSANGRRLRHLPLIKDQ